MRFASMKTGLSRWAVLPLALGLLLAGAARTQAEPPVWRIRGAHSEIVLFGSVHLLTPGLEWRSPALAADLAKADSVWFEIPLDDSTRAGATAAAAARSRLPAGRTLPAMLSAKGRARLARVAAAVGLPTNALDPYRPWFAEVTLTLLYLQREGAQQGAGVEETLSRQAPPTAVRHAFETPEEQVRLLAGSPDAEQVASLEETLEQIENDPAAFTELQKAWVDGDTGWIEREAVAPLRKAAPGLYRRLVTARNLRWADQIQRLLKRPERAFIVVGVGHLVGPDSVPALLRRRGVAVEGP